MSSKFSIGEMNKLADALEKAGFSSADITNLRISRDLALIKEVLNDCDAAPFCPAGWKVEEHQPGGMIKWDPKKISLYLPKEQKKGINGHDLRKVLAKKPVLNANVLDFLIKNPHLIPEEWKGKAVFFWGTIYRDAVGYLCVRYLYWNGDRWRWDYFWLDNVWRDDYPAALLE